MHERKLRIIMPLMKKRKINRRRNKKRKRKRDLIATWHWLNRRMTKSNLKNKM